LVFFEKNNRKVQIYFIFLKKYVNIVNIAFIIFFRNFALILFYQEKNTDVEFHFSP